MLLTGRSAGEPLARGRGIVRAVDDVSFSLDRGVTLGVVGESGCGKSTLVRTLMRLEQPTAGRAVFAGTALFSSEARRKASMRRLQIVFQDPYAARNPGMSVFDILREIRLDSLGQLWVCDRQNGRLQVFDQDGSFVRQLSDIGGNPSDVVVGEHVIYAALKSGKENFGISIFSLDGERISAWGDTESATALFWSPHAIAVDSKSDIYLGEIRHAMRSTDKPNRALRKFARR